MPDLSWSSGSPTPAAYFGFRQPAPASVAFQPIRHMNTVQSTRPAGHVGTLPVESALAGSVAPPPPPGVVGKAGKEIVRKEKAREKERRRYYRNKDRMIDLQRQVESLECQLWAVSASAVDSESTPSTVDQESGATEATDPVRDHTLQLQQRLASAIRLSARLRNENTKLRRQFREESQRMALISDLLHSEHKLYVANSTYFRLLKPLTLKTCAAIHEDCVAIVDVVTQEMSPTMSGGLSGWNETRQVEDHLFKYFMKKTFRNLTCKAACAQQWAMLRDPVRYSRLYSDVLGAQTRFVQKLDDDKAVYFLQMRSMDLGADSDVITKALVLMSRFQTSTGYRIHIRGLDPDQILLEDLFMDPKAQVQELWNTSAFFTWVDFEDAGDACVVTFAGMTPTIISNATFWMTEVMLVCLRSVSDTIAPRFSLPE